MEMSMYQEPENDKKLQLRQNMSLDFATKNTKQHKFQNMLQSPDLNMLKLASPELEKMLITQNGTVGTTPTPSQFMYPNYVTDEQEAYARGFVEALAELHQTPGQMPTSSSSNGSVANTAAANTTTRPSSANTYSTLMPMSTATNPHPSLNTTSTLASMNPVYPRRHMPFAPSGLTMPNNPPQHSTSSYNQVQVKAEPSSSFSDHTVPRSPEGTHSSSRFSDSPSANAMSPNSISDYDHVENMNRLDSIPVDLEEQERIKLERKRARNRIAARKCRTRKMERIGRLEEKVSDLKNRNNELAQTASSLNDQVIQLKQQIMEHMKSGCQIMMPDMRNQMSRHMHM